MPEDYYQTLGVSRHATSEEIKKAYRRLAHKHHPDKKGGDEEAFKKVNSAYQVLSDAKKKSHYDQFGHAFEQGGGGPSGGPFGGFQGENININFEDLGGFGDIFEQFFGGGQGGRQSRRRVRRGQDIGVDLTISFIQAAQGKKHTLEHRLYQTCEACHGNGAEPGTPIVDCPRCGGQGIITENRQTILGTIAQQAICPVCRGEGKQPKKPCHTCRGEGRQLKNRKLVIDIPAGIADGQTIRLTDKGEAPVGGGLAGDLFATIHVSPHPHLQRDQDNVRSRVAVSFIEAALGAQKNIETLSGKQTITIPPGTQPQAEIRLADAGFPHLQASGRGDHIVTVQVEIPRRLTKKQKQLLQEFQKNHKKSFLGF